jgi:hypothetical protein
MMVQLLATIKQPNGNVAIADAPMSIQGEYYMVEMPRLLAENIWDAQATIYTLEANFKQVGRFDAICTGFIPFLRDGEELARASFVRSEFR